MPGVIIEKLDKQQLLDKKVFNWPVWEKDPSRFDWEYEGTEECYILEGEVIVETDHGMFTITTGDFVTFEDGLKCSWDIKKAIRKHYNFR